MIPFKQIQSINFFNLFDIQIYGLLLALGFLVAIFLAVREAKKRKLNTDHIYSLAFYIILATIIGGRLGYVINHLNEFGFIDIFKIWHGGMSYYGGFIFAVLFSYIYIKKHELNFWLYADVLTIPLIIGHAITRIGCYLTLDHPGKITNVPWAIYFNGNLTHPIALYEILSLTIIFLVIILFRKYKTFYGFLFLNAGILYAIARFITSFFRDADNLYYGLTGSQYVSILIFVIFSIVLVKKLKNMKWKISTR